MSDASVPRRTTDSPHWNLFQNAAAVFPLTLPSPAGGGEGVKLPLPLQGSDAKREGWGEGAIDFKIASRVCSGRAPAASAICVALGLPAALNACGACAPSRSRRLRQPAFRSVARASARTSAAFSNDVAVLWVAGRCGERRRIPRSERLVSGCRRRDPKCTVVRAGGIAAIDEHRGWRVPSPDPQSALTDCDRHVRWKVRHGRVSVAAIVPSPRRRHAHGPC